METKTLDERIDSIILIVEELTNKIKEKSEVTGGEVLG